MTPLTPYYLWHFHIFDKIDSFKKKKKIKGGNLHLRRTVLIVLLITHPTLRRRGDVVTTSLSLYVPATSQVRPKWNTQRRLDGTSPRRFSRTSPQRVIGTSPQRLKKVSNETPNGVTVVRCQDVSVVRIHDVLLARLYDVSCKSQIKHQKILLWYVYTTSWSYVFATSC